MARQDSLRQPVTACGLSIYDARKGLLLGLLPTQFVIQNGGSGINVLDTSVSLTLKGRQNVLSA